jgi:hypothetical protein
VNSRAITIASVALLFAATLVPQPASADRSFRPFKRGAENMLQSPLDLALSPVTAGIQAYKNLQGGKRSLGQKIAAYPFGFTWYTCLGAASTSARFVGGLLEVPVGFASLATGFEPGPIFNPNDLPALVARPTPPFDVRFGLYHVSD